MQLRDVSVPAIPTQRLSKPWAWGAPRLAHSTWWVRARWAQSADHGALAPWSVNRRGGNGKGASRKGLVQGRSGPSITSQHVASGLPGDVRLLRPGNSLGGRGTQGECWGLILSQQAEQPGAVIGILLHP